MTGRTLLDWYQEGMTTNAITNGQLNISNNLKKHLGPMKRTIYCANWYKNVVVNNGKKLLMKLTTNSKLLKDRVSSVEKDG